MRTCVHSFRLEQIGTVEKVFEVSLEGQTGEVARKSKTPSRVQSLTAREVIFQSAQSIGTMTQQCKVASGTGMIGLLPKDTTI